MSPVKFSPTQNLTRIFSVLTETHFTRIVKKLEQVAHERGLRFQTGNCIGERGSASITGSSEFDEAVEMALPLLTAHIAWIGTDNNNRISINADWKSNTITLTAAPRPEEVYNSVDEMLPQAVRVRVQADSVGAIDEALTVQMSHAAGQLELIEATIRKWEESIIQRELSDHARIFSDQASGHNELAKVWLVIAIMLAVATCIVACVLYSWVAGESPPEGGLVFVNLLFLSLPVGGLTAAMRQYSTERHNCIIETRRAQAIDTYTAFASLPEASIGVRESLLTNSLSLVFTPQDSGFVRRLKQTSPLPDFEKVKGLMRLR